MRRAFGLLLLVSFFFAAAAAAEVQQLYGPFFAADGVRSSRLLIHNKRGDLEVTLKVFALVGKGDRIPLAGATLKPKESRAIDIDAGRLRAAGRAEGHGGILIEYDFFEKQPLDATVMVRHRSGSGYIVPVLRRDQIRGTVQEAVFPLPRASARAFVAVQNTAATPRQVTIDAEASAGRITAATVDIAPQATEVIALDAALVRSGAQDAAAIRVVNSGAAGDVTVAGAVFDLQGNYAGRLRFNDLSHGEHSRTLRGQFLLLGRQDPLLGLPAGADFAAKCALRNATETPKIVHPRVKWLQGSLTREARLPAIHMKPREVRILDLAAAQTNGEIPAEFRFGVLEVPYEGTTGHVFAQLTNVDRTSGLVLDGSMTSHESHAVAGMEWSIEGDNQTLISITNASERGDELKVQLFTGTGTIDLPALELGGGEIALLNLRSIAGSLSVGASGTFSVRGAHGSRSTFRLERLMVTPSGLKSDTGRSEVEGPVAYVDLEGEERVLWIRTDPSQPPESEDHPPEEAYITLDLSTIARWSSGTATTDETNTSEYVTDDDALTVKAPPSPQVTVHITIYRPPNIGELRARFYDPCANNYLLTYDLRFGLPASAYVIYSTMQYPICWWEPTCSGTCSKGFHSSRAINTPSCYPAGAPYIQCFGLTVNGRCLVRVGICHFQGVEGFCT